MSLPKFKFVYIPADRRARCVMQSHAPRLRPPGARSSQPMEELEQELVPGTEVECLTNRLQAHFRRVSRRLRLGALLRSRSRAALTLRRAAQGHGEGHRGRGCVSRSPPPHAAAARASRMPCAVSRAALTRLDTDR
jgi:hypothetical protein